MTLALDKVTADAAAAALQHCSTAGHAAASPPRSRSRSGEATVGSAADGPGTSHLRDQGYVTNIHKT